MAGEPSGSGEPNASDCLRANKDRVIEVWEQRLRQTVPAAATERHPILINTVPAILDLLSEALAPEHPRIGALEGTTLAEEHGGERVRMTRFRLQDVITEYRLLREVLLGVLEEQRSLSADERAMLHTAIDEAMTRACTAYSLVEEIFREQLFAILAHDLRVPLNVISVGIDMIRDEPTSTEVPQWAARVGKATMRIDRMLQDLLDAMRTQAGGRLQFEPVRGDLMDAVRQALDQLRAGHGDRFVLDAPEHVVGYFALDPLRRAIENLGNNAVKYGAPLHPVTIKVSAHHERAIISVHNDGSYIPAEQRETLFRAFHRTRGSERGTRGWGLGLAQVRGVTEAHGGSIGIDSLPGRGTTFVIDIPIDARLAQDAMPLPR